MAQFSRLDVLNTMIDTGLVPLFFKSDLEIAKKIVKLFPSSSINGRRFVKAILEPCPWTRIMPTGGVPASEESITSWFRAGVSCIGMGSQLLRENFIAAHDFDGIASLARDILGWIRKARSEM